MSASARPGEEGPHRGRPRSQSAHRAILEASRDLVAKTGVAHLNLEQVAALAGVSKATIYRHWPTRESLLLELLLELGHDLVVAPESGNTREELVGIVEGTVRALAKKPVGRVLRDLLSEIEPSQAVAKPVRSEIGRRLQDEVAKVMARGIERGDIRPDADVAIATELLIGPVYYHLVFGIDFPADFAERLVGTVLDGYEAGRAG